MQILFRLPKAHLFEESCERWLSSARSDPGIESKNSVTLPILNCESSYAWFGEVDGKL